MRFIIISLLLLCAVISLTSCGNKQVFSQYKSIHDHTWQVDSLVKYSFDVDDTTTKHNVLIGVRNGVDYSYSNVFLFVKTTFPNKKSISDTVEIMLANPQGKWLGKKVNNLIDNQILYKRGILFPMKGKYNMTIQQGMRDAKLNNVFDMGVTVEQTQN